MVSRSPSDVSHNASKNTATNSESIEAIESPNFDNVASLRNKIRRLSHFSGALETNFSVKENVNHKSKLRRTFSLNDLTIPTHAIFDSAKEVKRPKQEISRFMLGFTQYSGKGIDDFITDPNLFFKSLAPNTLTANALFPTKKTNEYYPLCPLLTDEVREEFLLTPLLRATHRELANFALAKFGLKCFDKIVKAHNSIETNPPLWLKANEGANDRKMLFQIAESLFLLGNEELALNLTQTAISLLNQASLFKSARNFKMLRAKITQAKSQKETFIRLPSKRVIIDAIRKVVAPEVDTDSDKETKEDAFVVPIEKPSNYPFADIQRDLLKSLHNESRSQLFTDLTRLVPMSSSLKSEILEHLRKGNINHAIKKANDTFLASKEVSPANKEKGLKRILIEQYEAQGWKKLESKIEVLNTIFHNALTPHNSLHLDSNNEALTIFSRDIKEDQGISCYSTNLETSAANLWQSELFDESGNQIFSAIRHASLSFRPLDKELKYRAQQIAQGKVKELIFSALLSKHKKEIENRVKGLTDNKDPIQLKISSISLLTLFDMQLGPVKESEGSQFEQQRLALETLQNELRTVFVNSVAIPVEIKATTFSLGVNDLAMNPTNATSFIHRSNWRKADSINRMSLETLLGSTNISKPLGGWVKEALDKLSSSKEDRMKHKIIESLAYDIKQIFSNRLHHRENNERYALPKRVAYLSYLIGAVPSFNCKSGKDRTGMLDAEIKALAASLSVLKEPDKPFFTISEVMTLRSFHLDPLNFHVQRLNSGLSGNKVMAHHSEYFKAIFTPEQLNLMKGLI